MYASLDAPLYGQRQLKFGAFTQLDASKDAPYQPEWNARLHRAFAVT
jgi:hypothetical protein